MNKKIYKLLALTAAAAIGLGLQPAMAQNKIVIDGSTNGV